MGTQTSEGISRWSHHDVGPSLSFFLPLFLAPLALSAPGNGDEDLVTRIPVPKNLQPESCCNEDNLLTCERVKVNPDMLLEGLDDITINGISFTFSNDIEPHGLVYKTEAGDEAVITYNEDTGNMFGSVKTSDGRSFAIEKCAGGHIFKFSHVKVLKVLVTLLAVGTISNSTLMITPP